MALLRPSIVVAAIRNTQTIHNQLYTLTTHMQVMVVQTAPAVRVAIGEELGLAPGTVSTGQMVAALRALGFDHVFDTGACFGLCDLCVEVGSKRPSDTCLLSNNTLTLLTCPTQMTQASLD